MKLPNGARKILDRNINRTPAVAVVHDALQALWGHTAHDDRRVRFLDWLGGGPNWLKLDKLTFKRGLVLPPDALHGQDPPPQDLPPPLEPSSLVLPFPHTPTAPPSHHAPPPLI